MHDAWCMMHDPRSLTMMHVCMMHISMILDLDPEACMYVWCMYLRCGKFCYQRTDERTNKAILGVGFPGEELSEHHIEKNTLKFKNRRMSKVHLALKLFSHMHHMPWYGVTNLKLLSENLLGSLKGGPLSAKIIFRLQEVTFDNHQGSPSRFDCSPWQV